MTATPKATPQSSPADIDKIRERARRLGILSMMSTTAAGSGHPTSCLSAAELVAATFFHAMKFDPRNPNGPKSDRFVLSKGHAAPILYAALAEAGVFPASRLMTLRQFSSELEGHPTPRIPGVDAATGSLGQGLSVGAGLAIGAKMDNLGTRVFVLLGDGELAEGNVWEAAEFAGHYALDNLIALADINALGQSDRTMYQHDMEIYRKKFEAQGWDTQVIDGHDVPAVIAALDRATSAKRRPQAIVARTIKGHGISFLADKDGWHGKALSKEQLEKAVAELGGPIELPADPGRSYARTELPEPPEFPEPPAPSYKADAQIATREAYGNALKRIGAVNPHIVALDGDVKNSTFAEIFGKAFPERFFQAYIAEQNMIAAGVGLAARGKVPFLSSFACFLSRAYDQVRMASISRSPIKLCGSHCGISIGEDGPSQMALEDIAAFRAVHSSVILYPSDAYSAERLTEQAARLPGITYLRTSRPKTGFLYSANEKFPVPGFHVLCQSDKDSALIIGAGITVHEALKAYEKLKSENIAVRVVDLYCVKPIEGSRLAEHLHSCNNFLITVEDHYPEGGLGEAVISSLAEIEAAPARFKKLAVNGLPHSGKPDQLLDAFGISSRHIVAAVRGV